MDRFRYLPFFLLLLIFPVSLAGCKASYPKESVIDSIKRICKDEYRVDNVEVKIAGKTVGVYLPLQKLFSADFENMFQKGKLANLENFIKVHPEAMDKIDSVLNSLTRVILSTDRPVDFYVLKAVDTQLTGIQWTITGNVMDRKRVNFWDIPRSEFRKRLAQDLKINNAVLWKKTVRELFSEIGKRPTRHILADYFVREITADELSSVFQTDFTESAFKMNLSYDLLTLKIKPLAVNKALVYAKVKETYTPRPGYENYAFLVPSGSELEYLFVLMREATRFLISQVIPFYYVNAQKQLVKVQLPDELSVYQNLENWPDEFELNEVRMENFLTQQLNYRVQTLLGSDERIENTFQELKVRFDFEKGSEQEKGAFVMAFQFVPKGSFLEGSFTLEEILKDEDVRYVLQHLLSEFAYVLHDYRFGYGHLRIVFNQAYPLELPSESVEKFYKKKLTLDQLLAG